MASIYHIVPANLYGHYLYPLSQLRVELPDVYATAIAKYSDHPDRQHIPERRIPPLNCRWSDVVQFAPVHPRLILDAMEAVGMRVPDYTFIEVSIDRVQQLDAAWYFGMGETPEYAPLSWREYAELDQIPERTLDWYRKLASQNRTGALFHGIPHVMVRGSVSISGLPRIKLLDMARSE